MKLVFTVNKLHFKWHIGVIYIGIIYGLCNNSQGLFVLGGVQGV